MLSASPSSDSRINFQNIEEGSLESYKIGDLVTRANFTSFFIVAAGIGRGISTPQKFFLEWVIAQGHVSREVLQDLDLNSLNESEQEMILNSFRGVKKHAEFCIPETLEVIEEEFKRILNEVEFSGFNNFCEAELFHRTGWDTARRMKKLVGDLIKEARSKPRILR